MSSQMGKLSPKYQTLCAGLRHKHVWAKQKSRGLWKSRPAKERGALQRRPRGPAQRLEMLPLDVVPRHPPTHRQFCSSGEAGIDTASRPPRSEV